MYLVCESATIIFEKSTVTGLTFNDGIAPLALILYLRGDGLLSILIHSITSRKVGVIGKHNICALPVEPVSIFNFSGCIITEP